MKKNIKILISIFIAVFISTFAFTLKASKSEKVHKNKKVVGFKSDKYLNKIENLYKSDEDLDENIVKNKTKKTKEEKSSNNDELSKEIEKIIDEECQKLEGDWQVAVDCLKGDSKVSIF